MAKRLKTTTEQHRRSIVVRWKESGLSQAEFCRQERIPEWRLSEWKRRVARATEIGTQSKKPKRKARIAGVEFAAADDLATTTLTQAPIPKVGPFVPLVPAVSNASRKSKEAVRVIPVAEIQLGQLAVRIFSGADHETLRALLHILQEVSLC